MMVPTIGLKLTAVAVGVVGTAGVAAATTVSSAPTAQVSVTPELSSGVLDQLPVKVTLPELPEVTVPALPDLGTAPALPELPDVALPTGSLPSIPGVPALPDLPALPDPAAVAGQVDAAIGQVTALLPSASAFQAAVSGCVSDFAALSPVTPPAISGNPLGFLTKMLGSLGGAAAAPKVPSPAAVQGAVATCVDRILDVVPDPTALAGALTAAFPGGLPAPVAALVGQLTGQLPAAPSAADLVELVNGLAAATGSPTTLVDKLTGALDKVLPAPVAGLLDLPLGIVHEVFGSIGL